jgi:protocatechuate 3,4-dioxygenase beta subunit
MDKSRRNFFGASLMAAGTLAAGNALAQTLIGACQLTPAQTEGPFYPVKDQPDEDNDLTLIRGNSKVSAGQIIYVMGQVTDQDCAPVQNALVEIWQACATGRYNHPNDTNPQPLDPNFQYWGKSVTDAQGVYKFKTIIPGAYPADTDWIRPPHIHFKAHKVGYHELTTQMYFAGNEYNGRDKILMALPPSSRAQVVVTIGEKGLCKFNLTLAKV